MPPLPFNQIQYAEIGDWHGEPDHPGWRKVKVSLTELCGPGETGETQSVQPPRGTAAPASVPPTPRQRRRRKRSANASDSGAAAYSSRPALRRHRGGCGGAGAGRGNAAGRRHQDPAEVARHGRGGRVGRPGRADRAGPGGVASSAPAAASDTQDRHVMVMNMSSQTLRELYASPVTSDSWEEDLLGSRVLAAGESINANIDNGTGECSYDLKAVMADGREHIQRAVDVCAISSGRSATPATRPARGAMVDVFISYSRTDLAAVTRLAQMVEAEGYDVWWDADLPPHLSYGDVITAKIGMAKAAIVVWSKDSAASEWVRAEADMARNQKKLVQTALDNVMPPLPFNQIQYAEIGDWHGEADHPGWRKVKVSLAELCGREPAEPRPATGSRRARTPPPAPPRLEVAALCRHRRSARSRWRWRAGRHARRDREEPVERGHAPPAEARRRADTAAAGSGSRRARRRPRPPAARTRPPAEPAVASTEGMVFPDSSRRLLRPAEIASFGPATLAIARNEIFARKGRRFARAEITDYFSQFDWYRPVADEVQLNAVERQNVALLRRAEARFGQ